MPKQLAIAGALLLPACSDDNMMDAADDSMTEDGMGGTTAVEALNPDTARSVVIDRFSMAAGMLQVRDASNGLPGPGEAVDFDQPPFITRGLGPEGESVRYYNFDVQPTRPAPIYALFREGEGSPVAGQLNIVDVIPGAAGYNDFWRVMRVTVPRDYVANTVTSVDQIQARGFTAQSTDQLVNCPIVPARSTATLRAKPEDRGLVRGWYRGQVVYYFSFSEQALAGSSVPVAPIYVTFNIDPGAVGGGPASGFRTETGSEQTHNVLAALPGSDGYSPLWSITPYDNDDFATVMDLASARAATILAEGVATVNCPVADIGN
ncbi:MAG: hypothetical protein ABI895_28300 [Deltaproteobacteria bacterium]